MKVTLAQINTTPNDFEGNSELINESLHKAYHEDSKLVVFPELTICGYNVKDLIYSKEFLRKNLVYREKIINKSIMYNDMTICVGYVEENFSGTGKPFKNMVAIIKNGMILTTYQKQLICFSDIFDEGRYFEPGNEPCVINIEGHKCGITICQDIWNDKAQDDYRYKNNPLDEYRKLEVDTIINLSSSPYQKDKPKQRAKILKAITEKSSIKNLIYVNQFGGQDDFVFDGRSCVVRNGAISDEVWMPLIPENKPYTKTLELTSEKFCSQPVVEEHFQALLMGFNDYIRKTGFKEVVIGSSGGIDSAVVIALSSMILGGDKVHCVKMPSKWSSEHSIVDAVKLHENFGTKDYTVKIDHFHWLEEMNKGLELKDYHPVADENIQARQRGQVIMHYSNATGALSLNTLNKSEAATAYFTIAGEAGTYSPIIDLYKMEVYEIAMKINRHYDKEMIPLNIIEKAASAELAPGQTDEESLLPFPILDEIVKAYVEEYIDNWKDFKTFIDNKPHIYHNPLLKEWVKQEMNEIEFVTMIMRIDNMEFKRRLAPLGTRLTKKAFGTGRRIPIVKG